MVDISTSNRQDSLHTMYEHEHYDCEDKLWIWGQAILGEGGPVHSFASLIVMQITQEISIVLNQTKKEGQFCYSTP